MLNSPVIGPFLMARKTPHRGPAAPFLVRVKSVKRTAAATGWGNPCAACGPMGAAASRDVSSLR